MSGGVLVHVVFISTVFATATTNERVNRAQKTFDPAKQELDHSPVLLSTSYRDGIRAYNLNTNETTTVYDSYTVFLDYHYRAKSLFWTKATVDQVAMYSLDHQASPTVVDYSMRSPEGLAVDWVHQNLYVVDSDLDMIHVMTLDGQSKRSLVTQGMGKPRAIVLDPLLGWMYWTDWGDEPKIEKCGMNGQARKLLYTENLGSPNGLAIDYIDQRLYFVDAQTDVIGSITTDGKNYREVLSSSASLQHGFSLTLHGDYVYWSDWKLKAVFRVAKLHTSSDQPEVTKVLDTSARPMGIRVYHSDRQPVGENRCLEANCSHLCLAVPKLSGTEVARVQCACPEGFEQKNSSHCSGQKSALLFVTTGHRNGGLVQVDLNTSSRSRIRVDSGAALHLVDFNYRSKTAFVMSLDTLYSLDLRTLETREVMQYKEEGLPEGLAIDWIHGNIYWTVTSSVNSNVSSSIFVSRADGTSRKTIITGNLNRPRAIVLDPNQGWMYYTDWQTWPRVEKATMDGQDRQVLVTDNVHWVNGLAIDYAYQRLYWTDAKLGLIGSVGVNGEDPVIVHRVGDRSEQPFAITVFHDMLFWGDRGTSCVYSISKWSRDGLANSTISTVLGTLDAGLPMGITVVDASRQPIDVDHCKDNPCSHLCLPVPRRRAADTRFRCACPDGERLIQRTKCQRAGLTTAIARNRTTPSPLTAENGTLMVEKGTVTVTNATFEHENGHSTMENGAPSLKTIMSILSSRLGGHVVLLDQLNTSLWKDLQTTSSELERLNQTVTMQGRAITDLGNTLDSFNRTQQTLTEVVKSQKKRLGLQEDIIHFLQGSTQANVFHKRLMLFSKARLYHILSTPVKDLQVFSSRMKFKTLMEANGSCAAVGGKLIELTQSELMEHVPTLLRDGLPNAYHWTGWTRQDGGDEWTFLSNEKPMGNVTSNGTAPNSAQCARFLPPGLFYADLCTSLYGDRALCTL